jgi:lipopolysaccharide transport system ATP-binding protein
MSHVAIRVDGLGKVYHIRHLRRNRALRDVIAEAAAAPFRRLRHRPEPSDPSDDWMWALRDVSFEVRRGEVLGVVGGNGAGKSTLLKILSRIVEPTKGSAEIHGRVGSLLEVGTGFHSELSGRENIYLNGAILGMRRAEIARRFDEIVAFAEVERFIDTPVKHYSSGMYMRLAFAVAAHLEPEILIVDEVLAVGDAAFQRKCLGRMEDVAQAGRTVLFVSHNMDAVRRLCTRGVLLQAGQVAAAGETSAVIATYLSRDTGAVRPASWIELGAANRVGTGEARFTAACYRGLSDDFAGHLSPGGGLEISLVIHSDVERTVDSLAVYISSPSGTKLVNADTIALGGTARLRPGANSVCFKIEQVHLTPGPYLVGLWLAGTHGRPLDHVASAFAIEVVSAAQQGFGITPASNGLVPCRFTFEQTTS